MNLSAVLVNVFQESISKDNKDSRTERLFSGLETVIHSIKLVILSVKPDIYGV